MQVSLYNKMSAPMIARRICDVSRFTARSCSSVTKTGEESVKKVKEPIRKRLGMFWVGFFLYVGHFIFKLCSLSLSLLLYFTPSLLHFMKTC